jgi:hypothetical protein
MCAADKARSLAQGSVVHAEAPGHRAPPIHADHRRSPLRARGGASACADIEQSRVRNAIVPGRDTLRRRRKNIRRMVNAATKSRRTPPWPIARSVAMIRRASLCSIVHNSCRRSRPSITVEFSSLTAFRSQRRQHGEAGKPHRHRQELRRQPFNDLALKIAPRRSRDR